MTDPALFSLTNVTAGFVVSWFLAHYVLPLFGYERSLGRTTTITAIFTVAALVRNFIVYSIWVAT